MTPMTAKISSALPRRVRSQDRFNRGGPRQVSQVLDVLIQAHQALYRYYCDQASRKKLPERYNLMRVAERELRVCQGLRRFQMENQQGILETWVRFQSFPDLYALMQIDQEEPTFADSESVLQVEEKLHRLTLSMSAADAPPRVQALFEDILELELERLRRKSFSSLLDQDA